MIKTIVSKLPIIVCFLIFIQPSLCHAQKHCDLSLSIVSPLQGAEIPFGDTMKLYVSIKNLGPDDIDSASETFIFSMEGAPFSSFFSNKNLPAGDSMVYMAYSFVSGVDSDTHFAACFYVKADTSTFIDNNQGNDTACLDIILKAEENSGIGDVINNKRAIFELHPNPARKYFFILMQTQQANKYGLVIQNILGHTVHKELLEARKGKNEFTLDISKLSPGIYFVKAIDAQGTVWSKKLVIK